MGLLYDNSLTAFVIVTLVLGGGAAWMTGRAVALSWQPLALALAYMVPLAASARFLHFALAHGTLLSPQLYAVDVVILAGITSVAWRATRAWQMASQYPWLYQRTGPLTWREVGGHAKRDETA